MHLFKLTLHLLATKLWYTCPKENFVSSKEMNLLGLMENKCNFTGNEQFIISDNKQMVYDFM